MFGLPSQSGNKENKQEKGSFAISFKPENFIPGVIIGFIIGLFCDLSKPSGGLVRRRNFLPGKRSEQCLPSNKNRELKMVLVVRQDIKMSSGKIAAQCAHAATGLYAELMQSDRYMLRKWEECGQPKIVCTCKSLEEMNKLRETAENIGLATFIVTDAGRTEVKSGTKTVLAVGPGPKEFVDSVTGKLRLL